MAGGQEQPLPALPTALTWHLFYICCRLRLSIAGELASCSMPLPVKHTHTPLHHTCFFPCCYQRVRRRFLLLYRAAPWALLPATCSATFKATATARAYMKGCGDGWRAMWRVVSGHGGNIWHGLFAEQPSRRHLHRVAVGYLVRSIHGCRGTCNSGAGPWRQPLAELPDGWPACYIYFFASRTAVDGKNVCAFFALLRMRWRLRLGSAGRCRACLPAATCNDITLPVRASCYLLLPRLLPARASAGGLDTCLLADQISADGARFFYCARVWYATPRGLCTFSSGGRAGAFLGWRRGRGDRESRGRRETTGEKTLVGFLAGAGQQVGG